MRFNRYTVYLALTIALISFGAFYAGLYYGEKATTVVEIPKTRTITKTQYVDRVTNLPVIVEVERTDFDSDATLELAKARIGKQNLMIVQYGIQAGSFSDLRGTVPVWGFQYSRKVWGRFYLGGGLQSNGVALAHIGMEF